jgi:hypothetical protein
MDGMPRELANRFVSVAQLFLLSCVSVLLGAAAYSLISPATATETQSYAHILFSLLR